MSSVVSKWERRSTGRQGKQTDSRSDCSDDSRCVVVIVVVVVVAAAAAVVGFKGLTSSCFLYIECLYLVCCDGFQCFGHVYACVTMYTSSSDTSTTVDICVAFVLHNTVFHPLA